MASSTVVWVQRWGILRSDVYAYDPANDADKAVLWKLQTDLQKTAKEVAANVADGQEVAVDVAEVIVWFSLSVGDMSEFFRSCTRLMRDHYPAIRAMRGSGADEVNAEREVGLAREPFFASLYLLYFGCVTQDWFEVAHWVAALRSRGIWNDAKVQLAWQCARAALQGNDAALRKGLRRADESQAVLVRRGIERMRPRVIARTMRAFLELHVSVVSDWCGFAEEQECIAFLDKSGVERKGDSIDCKASRATLSET